MGPFQLIVLILIPFTEAKVKKSGYYPVSACPIDAKEWETSSRRLKCNNTHSYHCAPYHDRSQLYEFCYAMAVLKVKKGHCLGVAESGILNFDSCHFFSQGCPNEDYQSNEMYKYPSCLSIQENCYTEDCVCNCFTAAKRSIYSKEVNQHAEQNQNRYLIPFVICCIMSVLSIILNVLQLIRSQSLKKGKPEEEKESFVKGQTEEEKESFVKDIEKGHTHSTGTHHHFENEKHQIYKMTLTSYTIEDSEIFGLLKRHCLDKTASVFKNLVSVYVKPQNKYYIFKQCDENGCILLHFAAQGGETSIVTEILENVPDDILEYKNIRGETALHFAIRYKQTNTKEKLIEMHKRRITRLRQEAETVEAERLHKHDGNSRNLKDDILPETLANENADKNAGEFSPVHLAAWTGDVRLLQSLKQSHFDISTTTRNGLNILDIACMSDELKGQIEFCRHLLQNESDKILSKKTDLSGWNIAHYAAMSNINLLKYIKEEEKRCDLILEKTKSKKTCLHIACEYGKLEIVTFIVKHFKKLVHCVDDFGRNAVHFAAKGGNLEILKHLNKNDLDPKSLTSDNRTILHIACIHKNVEICRYAVEHFPIELLNAKTKKRGLTAAHFLGRESKEDGSELEILEMLCKSEMDLKALSSEGLSVLDRAIDQVNTDLIQAMSSPQFREKCGINPDVLKKKLGDANNAAIRNVLKTVIEKWPE